MLYIGACRGQERVTLKLELQAVVSHPRWMLGTGTLKEPEVLAIAE